MGASDDEALLSENRRLSRFNAREMTALEMIAEHRPENETLLQICHLVHDGIAGSLAVVVRRRSDDHLDVVTTEDLPTRLRLELLDHIGNELRRIDATGAPSRVVEFDVPSAPDDGPWWCEVIAGLGGRPTAALCVGRLQPDPTNRAIGTFRHAARLIQIAAEQVDSSNNFVETIAAEREVIANHIHDDPVQSITVLSLRLQRLAREVPSEYRDAVLSARIHADDAIDGMRRLLFDLHPTMLDDDGLTAAIEGYLEEALEPFGVTWTVDDRLTHTPSTSVSILAYRLTHEALANIAGHAEATKVAITLDDDDDTLTIRITDDGKGFDPTTIPPHRPGHLGLPNARYIARRAAGRFDISSTPGAGCTVEIHLPTDRRVVADTHPARH